MEEKKQVHSHTHTHTLEDGTVVTHSHTHSHTHTKAVLNRLSRAIGHLESIRRMVEEGRDCSEVLIQLSAVKAAINNTGKVILQDHIEHCIVDAVESGDKEALDELNKALQAVTISDNTELKSTISNDLANISTLAQTIVTNSQTEKRKLLPIFKQQQLINLLLILRNKN